jgi:hypothetical protein
MLALCVKGIRMSDALNYENWYQLRNLVVEASWSKKLIEPNITGYDSITDLVKEFLRNGDESVLNSAAQQVANLCPGATEEGKRTPWLLLEKS